MLDQTHIFYSVFLVILLNAGPGIAGQKPFAEYWIPHSDGETIHAYLVSKQKIGIDQFAVTYRNIDSDRKTKSTWTSKASVDCRNNSVKEDGGLIEIDPHDKDASMATIIPQNLWWLVCRGVRAKYWPHIPNFD